MKKIAFMMVLLSGKLMALDTLQFKKTIEIEIDPLAYAMKGYSVHAVYVHKHFRYDLGVYGIETPGKLTGNKDFTIRSTGFGLKVNYMLNKINGFYIGMDGGYGQTEANKNNEELSDKGHSITIGAHLGYRLFLFSKSSSFAKGIYLTPWLGASYNNAFDKIKLKDYKTSNLGYFAACHIGYRF